MSASLPLLLLLTFLIWPVRSVRRTRSCYSPVKGYIFCSHTIQDQWNFVNFRSWLDSLKTPVDHVELSLRCLEGGSVVLPWPMRARGLKKIKITNCVVEGFFSEYNLEPAYPDSLVDFSMIDCIIRTDVNSNIQRTLMTTISKSYSCGQQTIRSHVMRNISFSFLLTSSPPSSKTLDRAFSAMRRQSKTRDFTCNYDNLLQLEESNSDSISSVHFEVMTDISSYSSLRTFNFSSNRMTRLPDHLREWHKYFPTLEVLDLSKNHLRSFSFEKPKSLGRRKIFFVNLQHNKISDVPRDIASYLDEPIPVILDLRNNPILCTYNTIELVKYLNKIKNMFPVLNFLTDIRCTLSPNPMKSKSKPAPEDNSNDTKSKLLQLFNLFGV